MAGQLLSNVSGYSSTEFDTKIPALTDTANIQEAFLLYHYGLDSYDGSIDPAADSIESHFVSIDSRITDIENTPTGGGIVQDEVPHLLVKEGGGTDSVPEGYIWVDGDGNVPSITSAGVVSYINNEPLEPIHGQVWVDKDTDIAPVNISNYLSVSDASSTYITQLSGSASDLSVTNLLATSASITGLLATSASVTGLIELSTIEDSLIEDSIINDSSISRALLKTSKEIISVSASAATGTVNVDTLNSSVFYYTLAATANWTFNIRADESNTLNSIMNVGEALTLAFLITNAAVAYYPTIIQVDGSNITPEWQGGSAPISGNVNSIDSYTFTIIKTGFATFTVLGAQTQFA